MKRFLIISFNDQGIITRTADIPEKLAQYIQRAHDIGLQCQVYETKLIDEDHPEAGLKYVYQYTA